MDDLVVVQHFGTEQFCVANSLNGQKGDHSEIRIGSIGPDPGQKIAVVPLDRRQHARIIRDHRQQARGRWCPALLFIQKMLDIGADHGVRAARAFCILKNVIKTRQEIIHHGSQKL